VVKHLIRLFFAIDGNTYTGSGPDIAEQAGSAPFP
jgi:hypothetical protein